MCINYVPFNSYTKRMNWPSPDIGDVTDALAGCSIFLSCNLTKAFHQWEIVEEHRHYTAFITHLGLFEFNRVPLGVHGGPPYLSKEVAKLLRSCPNVQKFFDDLVAGNTSEKELLEVAEQLLSELS
jgi:hypothetical protein